MVGKIQRKVRNGKNIRKRAKEIFEYIAHLDTGSYRKNGITIQTAFMDVPRTAKDGACKFIIACKRSSRLLKLPVCSSRRGDWK